MAAQETQGTRQDDLEYVPYGAGTVLALPPVVTDRVWRVFLGAQRPTPSGAFAHIYITPAHVCGDPLPPDARVVWFTRAGKTATKKGGPGKLAESAPTVVAPKNVGKKNETTPLGQGLQEVRAKRVKYLKRAGAAPPEPGGATAPLPMLAAWLVKPIDPGEYFFQYKYDGGRVVAWFEVRAGARAVRLTSRTGVAYDLPHLHAGLLELVQSLPDEVVACVRLDCEAYKHGLALQRIMSAIRTGGAAAAAAGIQLYMFDLFFADGHVVSAGERDRHRQTLFAGKPPSGVGGVVMVESHYLTTQAEVDALHQAARTGGFEGLVARLTAGPYEPGTHGHHSKNMLKIKRRYDTEYPVVGYDTAENGRDAGAVMWICEADPAVAPVGAGLARVPTATQFRVTPKGTKAERIALAGWLAAHPEDYAVLHGTPMTVQHQSLAESGRPTQGIAVGFRPADARAAAVQAVLDRASA
jgi:ATP-dependent DNA ligase